MTSTDGKKKKRSKQQNKTRSAAIFEVCRFYIYIYVQSNLRQLTATPRQQPPLDISDLSTLSSVPIVRQHLTAPAWAG